MSSASITDPYQKRYLAHQQRKKEILIQLLADRHSDRLFSDEDVSLNLVNKLVKNALLAPSSCDRHGVSIEIISDRDRKELLAGILVGAVGWTHRAKHILIFMGEPLAYKAGNEIEHNPYLDAGVIVQNISLLVAANNLAGCFINPTIRDINKSHFRNTFGDGIFCGAYAIGKPIN